MKIRDRIVEFRRVPAGELQPNPRNWRTHPKAQQEALRGVLAEIGYAGAALAFKTPEGGLMLIDGHLRAETTPEAMIPTLVTDLTPEEANLLLASYDPLAAMAEADKGKLDALLKDVQTGSEALQGMLADLAKESGLYATPEITEDEVPEPPADPVTKAGDLWVLGEHRLLCGDSRKTGDITRVMAGSKASAVFTDPPYGVSIGAKNRMLNSVQPSGRNLTDIVDDQMSPEELEESLLEAFINIRTHAMAEDCTLFVCSPQGCGLSMMMMMMMMQKAGLKARHVLIWKKNQPTFSMGRLDYDYAHEPILLTWLKRHKRPMGGMHRTSVWEVDKPRKSAEHPTMKPVELYANAYLNNSDSGDVVFDAYSGSGTMFVAAEQVGRIARGIEISPAYCDVIVQRWEKLTGHKAVLENDKRTKCDPERKRNAKRTRRAISAKP